MTENPEKMKELLGSFLDPESALKAVEDMDRGLDLLQSHPAPAPDPERIAAIKRDIQSRIGCIRRRQPISVWIGWSACAAAVLLVVAHYSPFFRPSRIPLKQGVEIVNLTPWTIDTEPLLSGIPSNSEDIHNDSLKTNSDFDSPNPIETLEQELKMLASTDDFWKG
ncbi:MAG: hypothetical protein GX455_05710 [Phycisphaerae bacterium]|nr:hypothetical protein [Phycisphaerae bacterium]